jgi:hypothetical protein
MLSCEVSIGQHHSLDITSEYTWTFEVEICWVKRKVTLVPCSNEMPNMHQSFEHGSEWGSEACESSRRTSCWGSSASSGGSLWCGMAHYFNYHSTESPNEQALRWFWLAVVSDLLRNWGKGSRTPLTLIFLLHVLMSHSLGRWHICIQEE